MIGEERPDEREYERFSPSAFYELGELDVTVSPGEYYVAVYDHQREGDCGLVVGNVESFTVVEFVRVPLDLLVGRTSGRARVCSRSLPFLVTLAVGLILLLYWIHRPGSEIPLYGLIGAISVVFLLGSFAVLIYQTIYALNQVPANSQVAITLVFPLIPLVLGSLMIGMGLKGPIVPTARTRIYLAIIGVVTLFLWPGYYIGPALVSYPPSSLPHQPRSYSASDSY